MWISNSNDATHCFNNFEHLGGTLSNPSDAAFSVNTEHTTSMYYYVLHCLVPTFRLLVVTSNLKVGTRQTLQIMPVLIVEICTQFLIMLHFLVLLQIIQLMVHNIRIFFHILIEITFFSEFKENSVSNPNDASEHPKDAAKYF